MTITEQVHNAVSKHADAIIPAITKVAPQHSAILPSELLAFCCLSFHRGVQTIIESGRKLGFSTEVLSNVNWTVVSIDTVPVPEADQRLSGRPNLLLLHGDGELFVRNFTPLEVPAAALLDGPKGMVAHQLAMEVRSRYAVLAIHDAHPGSELRERVKKDWYLTDDPWLLENYGHLDEAHLKHCGYGSHSELLATSSTLAIW